MEQVRSEEPVKEIGVGLHYGNVIGYLSNLYGTGFDVVREGVQNAVDVMAKNIFVMIDCAKRVIAIYDDGEGASELEITEKFNQIGVSNKVGKPDMAGHKGIGSLAPFAVGRQWQLFTRDIKAGEKLRAYTFDRAELVKGKDIKVLHEQVPFKSVIGAPFPSTTMLRIVDVDEGILRRLGDKNAIERTIREAFNVQLRGRNIVLRIAYRSGKQSSEFVIKPTKFRGAPIHPIDYETKHGAVTFEFYHSVEPLKDLSILVLHQGVYSLPLTNFFKLQILPQELELLFTKGYFEGEIRLGFCKINASRSAFEHNDELQSFVQAMEQFTAEQIRPRIEQWEQEDREEKLRVMAEKELRFWKQFFTKHPEYMPTGLKTMVVKKAIEGPEPPEDEVITPPEKKKRKPLDPDAFKREREKRKGPRPPKPQKPIVELRDGLDLKIVNPAADDELIYRRSRLMPQGVIQINGRHDDFTEAERRGQTICRRYVSLLIQKEFTCASLAGAEANLFGQIFEKTFFPFFKASLME